MSTTTNTELLDAGEQYITKGLPVIPCNGKAPCDATGRNANEWQHKPATIERLTQGLAAASSPAIGLIMGPKSGIIDIETDDESEVDAVQHLFRDCEPVVTPTYTSPRGRHVFYKYDPCLEPIGKGVFTYKDPLGNSVKIRLGLGDKGAQSIIPPSEGREWAEGLSLDECDVQRLPEVVVQRLLDHTCRQNAEHVRNGAPVGNYAGGVCHDGALSAMAVATFEKTDGNDGSLRLFTVACRAVDADLSDVDALATIRAYEQSHPFPKPWSDAEILKRIRDAEKKTKRGSAVVISNYRTIETTGAVGKTKSVAVPLSMCEIIADVFKRTDDFPRRVDNMLFVDDPEHGLDYFDRRTTAGLFGYLRRRCKVSWKNGADYVSQAELFAELERTATKYDAIEVLPHEPPVSGIYYRSSTPKPGDGSYLKKLLDRFRPETTVDRVLLQAAFMTPFCGGLPGTRPAFVITSDDGRGVGKTKAAEAVGYLCGGHIDVSAGEDIEKLKTRLLSPGARTMRIALIDNVKSLKLSWAELEAMITSPIISGRQLFVGEGQRPNYLTWLLTLNGVSMAPDMAMRAVIIKIVKGENSGPWWEQTRQFIDEHRQEIIGDIIAGLRAEPKSLAKYGRWAGWEQNVLSRLPNPNEAQRLILERQGEANCELDEADIVEEFFAGRLSEYGYDPQVAQVRIPVAVAADWFGMACNERVKTASASRRLKQMASEGTLKRISPDPSRTHGRCVIWTGPAADVRGEPIANDLERRIASQRDAEDA